MYRNELVAGFSNGVHRQTSGGASWSLIGTYSPSSSATRAFVEYNGNLIVAGSFSAVSGVTVNGIASWDGTAWSALDAGIGSSAFPAYALVVYSGKLAVGGRFTSVNNGTVGARGVALWDGAAWHPVGTGVNFGDVRSLFVV